MTESQKITVVGVFEDYGTADRVARELTSAGIPREAIDLRSNFRTGAAGRTEEDNREHEGGISGFFHRLFGGGDSESEHAHDYAEMVRRGNAVVSVTAPREQANRAAGIMNDLGAIDIDRRVADYRKAGYRGYDENAPAYSREEAEREREQYRNRQGGATIPVVEEELEVGKRVVRRGGVRVYSQVRDVPVEEEVTLREEHVKVERRPANRPLNAGEKAQLRDQTIEVTESAEVPVVQKRARVREEVVVGKETTERKETVSDTVRRTEVKVDQLRGEGERVEDEEDDDIRADFRRDFDNRYASHGADWDAYAPAYDYGYQMASNPKYQGRDWDDVEDDLRNDYSRREPGSTWERIKDSVRYGWDKVTGRTR